MQPIDDRAPEPASAAPGPLPHDPPAAPSPAEAGAAAETAEIGGPPGPEPTRFGDWERKGRCIDF